MGWQQTQYYHAHCLHCLIRVLSMNNVNTNDDDQHLLALFRQHFDNASSSAGCRHLQVCYATLQTLPGRLQPAWCQMSMRTLPPQCTH
jgi:hypothetical protein